MRQTIKLIQLKPLDNILKYNPKDITNSFAHYFANVDKTYSQMTPNSKEGIGHYLKKIPRSVLVLLIFVSSLHFSAKRAHPRQAKTLFLTPTTPVEINRLIEKLPNKKSSGYDLISNSLLKELKEELGIPLYEIFNLSLKEGVFSSAMKLADVVPVFKSKTRDEPTNYRPISLLLTLSKLLEKIIYKRTYEFLETNNSLCNSQYGFRSKHSCKNAVSELDST